MSSKQRSKEKEQRYSSAKLTRLSTEESPIKNPSAKKSLVKSRKFEIQPIEVLKAVKTEIHDNLKEMGNAIESIKQIMASNLNDDDNNVG